MLQSMLDGSRVPVQCSRAGCQQRAQVALNWRNPKIHREDRVKTWLACEEHLDYLTEFLRARSFPVWTEPVKEEDGGV